MTPWTGSEVALVADQRSGFWAFGSGRLTRLDSDGRMTASWTFADDPLFAAWGIVAARAGGVWLYGGPTIAWFDGERLRDVINAPGWAPGFDVADMAEAADASIWAVTRGTAGSADGSWRYESRVLRWDGQSWTDICGRLTRAEISQIAIDPNGGVWAAPANAAWDVSYFDGISWSIPPGDVDFSSATTWSNASASGLVAADDGSVWIAQGGLARFDGSSWTGMPLEGVDLSGTVSLASGPGGGIWAATGSTKLAGDVEGVTHAGIVIVRFDGRIWTTYDSADGLPAPDPSTLSTITAVAASRDGAVAATRDGFYRLSGDRWTPTGPRPAIGAESWPEGILAVSADEAWVRDSNGALWSVRAGAWARLEVAGWKPPLRVFNFARGPDGALAVATDRGAAVLRGGGWNVLEEGEALDVTFARDGVLWVAERSLDSDETTVTSFRFSGRAWERTVYPALSGPGWPSFIVGRDGSPWVAGGWFWSLVRFDGKQWVDESRFAGPDPAHVVGLEVGPDGDLWVAFERPISDAGSEWAIARYDGTTWTVHDSPVDFAVSGYLGWSVAFAVAPDGSVWLATGQGVARFDGQDWSSPFVSNLLSAMSFGPDGTLWAVGPSGVLRLPAAGGG
jgi:hypothetical protein